MKRLLPLALIVIASVLTASCQDVTATVRLPDCPVALPAEGNVSPLCMYDSTGKYTGYRQ